MLRDFSDNELMAQILSCLWDQGSYGEIYTNYTKMKKRLDHIVKNDGKNIEKKAKELPKINWVEIHKNGDTISLNPIYKIMIKNFRDQYLA
jgi:hypothetical protein